MTGRERWRGRRSCTPVGGCVKRGGSLSGCPWWIPRTRTTPRSLPGPPWGGGVGPYGGGGYGGGKARRPPPVQINEPCFGHWGGLLEDLDAKRRGFGEGWKGGKESVQGRWLRDSPRASSPPPPRRRAERDDPEGDPGLSLRALPAGLAQASMGKKRGWGATTPPLPHVPMPACPCPCRRPAGASPASGGAAGTAGRSHADSQRTEAKEQPAARVPNFAEGIRPTFEPSCGGASALRGCQSRAAG